MSGSVGEGRDEKPYPFADIDPLMMERERVDILRGELEATAADLAAARAENERLQQLLVEAAQYGLESGL